MPSPAVHALPLRVYAADTDASGIVHHAQYLRYAERARTEMLRDHGIALDTIADVAAGYWIVRRAMVAWRAPARLDDLLIVESRVAAVRGASIDMGQRVTRDGAVLVEMDLSVAYVSARGRPVRVPSGWRAALDGLAADGAGAW